ncbi:hypothetical protein O7A70_24020 [Mesorhizobium sp. Cs1299R1N1]
MKRSILLAATAVALLGLLVTARSFVSVVDQAAPVAVTPPSH